MMHSKLSWESGGLLVTYEGQITSMELSAVVRRIQEDERYDTIRYILHDCTACTGATYTPTNLEELAATDHAAAMHNPRVRAAVIATHPEMIAFTRQYLSAGLNRHEWRIFSTLEQARDWVGTS